MSIFSIDRYYKTLLFSNGRDTTKCQTSAIDKISKNVNPLSNKHVDLLLNPWEQGFFKLHAKSEKYLETSLCIFQITI